MQRVVVVVVCFCLVSMLTGAVPQNGSIGSLGVVGLLFLSLNGHHLVPETPFFLSSSRRLVDPFVGPLVCGL